MKTLKERILGLIDESSLKAKDFIDGVSETVNSINWDSHLEYLNEQKDSLLRKSAELFGEFNDLLKQVKDSLSDFTVVVPFNDGIGEKLEYNVEDGILHILVSYEDETTTRTNKTQVKIPSNCDVSTIRHEVNKSLGNAKIIISKVIDPKKEDAVETEENTTARDEVKPKKKATRKPTQKKKATQKSDSENNAVSTEELSQVSEKLKSKLNANAQKFAMHRAANGRFVRKEAPNA